MDDDDKNLVISGVPPVSPAPGDLPLASPAVAGRAASAAEPAHPRRRRLLVVLVAVAVLRGLQAAVAAVTVLAVAALRLEQPLPHLHVARLTEVGPRPLTPLTALVMVAVSAAAAILLLSRRRTVAAFAGVKAFALVVASTIAGVVAAGPGDVRLAVAGFGAGLAVLLWPAVRRAAVTVLTAVGLPHPTGRLADIALAVKISLLVAFAVFLT
jgi:hypothetical protein